MPLTVEEVSFHLQFCLVLIWSCSHICKTSGCEAPPHVAQHVVRQGSGELQRLHFFRNVDSFWTHQRWFYKTLNKHKICAVTGHVIIISAGSVVSLHLSPFYITHTHTHTHVNSLHASPLSSHGGTGVTLCHFSYWEFRFDVAFDVCCFKERLHCLFLFTQRSEVWAHDPYQVKMSTGLFLAYLHYGGSAALPPLPLFLEASCIFTTPQSSWRCV